MNIKTKTLLALAGGLTFVTSSASAATYNYTAGREDQFGVHSINGSFVTSDVESSYAGYYFIESIHVDHVTYAGQDEDEDWDTGEVTITPFAYTGSDLTYFSQPEWFDGWRGWYNPETSDIIGNFYDFDTGHVSYATADLSHAFSSGGFGQGGDIFFQAPDSDFSFYNPTITVAGAVPEPATWAMMIGGIGLAGGAMRRRQRQALRFA